MNPAFKVLATPTHPDGWKFFILAAVIAVLGGLLWLPLFVPLAVVACWVLYFFRDPDRAVPTRPGLIVAPGDGTVSLIAQAVPPWELDMGPSPRTRISIFLNIFDVHVQRMPMDGVVGRAAYRKGKFFNAALDKASEENERMALRIDNGATTLAVVQIAGLVARRIHCEAKAGDSVRAGQRYGIIRFGSRVDVYLPEGASPLVAVGQRAVAGETVFADLSSDEGPRDAEVR